MDLLLNEQWSLNWFEFNFDLRWLHIIFNDSKCMKSNLIFICVLWICIIQSAFKLEDEFVPLFKLHPSKPFNYICVLNIYSTIQTAFKLGVEFVPLFKLHSKEFVWSIIQSSNCIQNFRMSLFLLIGNDVDNFRILEWN